MSDTAGKHLSQAGRYGYDDPNVTSLRCGMPGPEILRKLPPLMTKATEHRMKDEIERNSCNLFQYGIEEGDYIFRDALSEFLSEEYGQKVESKNLILTAGASSSLWNILTMLFKPGAIVFVEDATYFIAISMFQQFGAVIVPVKTDADGIIIEDFKTKLQSSLPPSGKDASSYKALLYLIPIFHNPTGRTMTEEKCRHVTEIAAANTILIVCDDVYNILHHGNRGSAPNRLFSCTRYENVISNGSFSKILAPGLRLGWMEAPTWMMERYMKWRVVNSGGGVNTYTAGIVANLISTGLLREHVQIIREEYKSRMLALKDELQTQLPTGCQITSPGNGGYFLWIELPPEVDADHLRLFSKQEYQVDVSPGTNSSASSNYKNFVRVSVSMYEEDVLRAAAKRFSQAIVDYQKRLAGDPDFFEKNTLETFLEN